MNLNILARKGRKAIDSLISKVTSWKVAPTTKASGLRETNFRLLFTPDYVMPRPFKPLPNISEFCVRTSRLDPLLDKGGIARMLSPEIESTMLSSRIKSTNRYLWIIQNQLESLLRKNQITYFWVFALLLMRRSSALRAVALRKLNPNWHREYPLGTVKRILTELDRTIRSVRTQLKIVRDYVEKVKPDGSKTYRPIGSPSFPDRMYTYLFQSFVVMFTENYVSKGQHAYFPGRGVPTAVRNLRLFLEDEQSKYRYVWEFDLKGAFPSIVIPEAARVFKLIGIPGPLVDVFEAISLRSVERVDLSPPGRHRLLEEPKFDRQEHLVEELPNKFFADGDFWQVGSKKISDAKELPMLYSDAQRIRLHSSYEPYGEIDELLLDDDWGFERAQPSSPKPAVRRPLLKDSPARHVGPITMLDRPNRLVEHAHVIGANKLVDSALEVKGFPQGLGLSPIFFNVCFEAAALRGHFEKLSNSVKVVSYADDFLVFSDEPLEDIMNESPEMKAMGLTFSREKSRMLKSDGTWLVDNFKFLGLTFMPRLDGTCDIMGTPRSGKELFFDKMETVEEFVSRDEDLRWLASALGSALGSQEVLDLWGQGVKPFNRIPWAVMRGERRLTEEDIEYVKSEGLKGHTGVFGNSTESERTLVDKHLRGSPLNAMGTRLAGLLISRLHGGSWEITEPKPSLTEVGSRSLRSKPSAEGTSWMDRILNVRMKYPNLRNVTFAAMQRVASRLQAYENRNRSLSIYNSTSHATVDLLRYQRSRGYMKLTKNGLIYKCA